MVAQFQPYCSAYSLSAIGKGCLLLKLVTWRLLGYPLPSHHGHIAIEVLLIVVYIGINVILLMTSGSPVSQLQNFAMINMSPLFFAGRTNPITDYLGISLHRHYLAHHWAGRVASAEGIAHSITAWPEANNKQRISGTLTEVPSHW